MRSGREGRYERPLTTNMHKGNGTHEKSWVTQRAPRQTTGSAQNGKDRLWGEGREVRGGLLAEPGDLRLLDLLPVGAAALRLEDLIERHALTTRAAQQKERSKNDHRRRATPPARACKSYR